MKAIILIILGLLFTGVDIFVGGMSYPAYEKNWDIGDKIQEYVTQYILSDHLKLDIFPDIVGCILLFIGVGMLAQYSKKFLGAQLFLFLTAVLSVALVIVPFFLNGKLLVITALMLFFFQVACELYMEFLVVYTLVGVSSDAANRATNTRMQFGWWITIFCRLFITFLTFVGHINVANVYKFVLTLAILFTVYQMYNIRKYIGSTRG